jgi:hypothetical protein
MAAAAQPQGGEAPDGGPAAGSSDRLEGLPDSMRLVLAGRCGSHAGKTLQMPFRKVVDAYRKQIESGNGPTSSSFAAVAYSPTDDPDAILRTLTPVDVANAVRAAWPEELAREGLTVSSAQHLSFLFNGRLLDDRAPFTSVVPGRCGASSSQRTGTAEAKSVLAFPVVHLVLRHEASSSVVASSKTPQPPAAAAAASSTGPTPQQQTAQGAGQQQQQPKEESAGCCVVS